MDGRIPLDRRYSDEGTGSGHSWARYGSARDAAELISELPSRQLGRNYLNDYDYKIIHFSLFYFHKKLFKGKYLLHYLNIQIKIIRLLVSI